MKNQNILAELRAWRDEFARAHGYDLRAMAAVLREMDAGAGARVVRGQPRPPGIVAAVESGPPNQTLQQTGERERRPGVEIEV